MWFDRSSVGLCATTKTTYRLEIRKETASDEDHTASITNRLQAIYADESHGVIKDRLNKTV